MREGLSEWDAMAGINPAKSQSRKMLRFEPPIHINNEYPIELRAQSRFDRGGTGTFSKSIKKDNLEE
jgi:hypothetical protein